MSPAVMCSSQRHSRRPWPALARSTGPKDSPPLSLVTGSLTFSSVTSAFRNYRVPGGRADRRPPVGLTSPGDLRAFCCRRSSQLPHRSDREQRRAGNRPIPASMGLTQLGIAVPNFLVGDVLVPDLRNHYAGFPPAGFSGLDRASGTPDRGNLTGRKRWSAA